MREQITRALGITQTAWDNHERKTRGEFELHLRQCSLCQDWFRTEFERHTCCPLCIQEFGAALKPRFK